MVRRHLRILGRFWKNCLIREMTFRTNFLINVGSEVGWVILTLVFLKIIFRHTADVRGWTEAQYLFLMGTHMIIANIFEALFFENCWRVSELIRTGHLDFVLLKPVNEQFLLSFERFNLSGFTNVFVGVVLSVYALLLGGISFTVGQLALYLMLVGAGVVMLYSLLMMFAITSVWMIRQTGLQSLWFYVTSLARYPAEIYQRAAGGVLWFGLVFIVPILLVANLPANVMVRTFEPWMVVYLVGASMAMLVLSAVVFRLALRWYRSASS